MMLSTMSFLTDKVYINPDYLLRCRLPISYHKVKEIDLTHINVAYITMVSLAEKKTWYIQIIRQYAA